MHTWVEFWNLAYKHHLYSFNNLTSHRYNTQGNIQRLDMEDLWEDVNEMRTTIEIRMNQFIEVVENMAKEQE